MSVAVTRINISVSVKFIGSGSSDLRGEIVRLCESLPDELGDGAFCLLL